MWKLSTHRPERRVVGAAHDLPRPVVGVHVPAPGQRLVRHAHAARGGPLGQGVQLLGDAAVVVDGVGGDRGADQDQVGAQRLHDGELVLARRRFAASRCGSTESKSRKGW
jgi:hypothetical protein